MTFDGVILYGPPASGKDTITTELCTLSNTYTHFQKLKTGKGMTYGYRPTTTDELAVLRNRGLIVHEVTRYYATYAVDSPHLDHLFSGGYIPVVHMGQIAGIDALRRYGQQWLDVLLWCPWKVTAERLRARGNGNIDQRLAAWDETRADLGSHAEPQFTLAIRTDTITPTTHGPVMIALRGGCCCG